MPNSKSPQLHSERSCFIRFFWPHTHKAGLSPVGAPNLLLPQGGEIFTWGG